MTTIPSSDRLIMVDTSAYYALSDSSETRSHAANIIRQGLITGRWRLFITNFVLAETHALLLIRLGYRFAIRFLDQLDQSPTTIIRVDPVDEQRAREILHRYDDKEFSFTDSTTFAVMERLGITNAFTFDRNFTQYGLNVLTPDHFSQR